jgi:hypothetical protein
VAAVFAQQADSIRKRELLTGPRLPKPQSMLMVWASAHPRFAEGE